MATVSPEIATGSTITFDGGFFAAILDMDLSGIERGSVDTTSMATTVARTFMPTDLFDPGELSVTIIFAAATRPPIDDIAAPCTVNFPGGTTWSASGFMTGFSISAVNEEMMTATGVMKFSGNITVS